jgi:hypothetical protein
MSYPVRLADGPERPVAEGVVDSDLMRFKTARADFWRAKETLTQVLTKVVGVRTVALSSAITDYCAAKGPDSHESVLIAALDFVLLGTSLFLPRGRR